jgi:hypothetical protein
VIMETAMIVARAIAINVLLAIISLFLSRPERTKIYILLRPVSRRIS